MTIEDDQLAARMAGELATHPPVDVVMTATAALHLIGLLQLVLRHPMISTSSRTTASAIIDQLRGFFTDCPATSAVIRQGDDPRQDRPRGES